jgi:hypothetical protein
MAQCSSGRPTVDRKRSRRSSSGLRPQSIWGVEFHLATDPEVLSRIAARPGERGLAQWNFALARMSFRGLSASHAGQAVWSAPPIALGPGSKLYDRREPFTEFTFEPGEGVNPPEGVEPIDVPGRPAQSR